MNRLAKAAVSVTGAVALSVGVVPMASAHEGDLKAEVGKWVMIDDVFTFPAGYACKAPVRVHEQVKFRDTLYKNKDGKVVKIFSEFKDWSNVTFRATVKKHHKKVTRSIHLNEGGDATIYNKKGDFDTILVKAEGNNWGQGAGIYGIPWTQGDISYKVVDANDPKKARVVDLDLSDATKRLQVCKQIGTKPVKGKNYSPPEEAASSSLMAPGAFRRS